MSSRPQFSLRMLVFATTVLALVAATSRPLTPPRNVGGSMGWDDLGFAIHAQAALRLVACLLLPSMFAAGVIAAHGNLKIFCFGAAPPSAVPPVLIWQDAAIPRMFDFISAANLGGALEVLQTAAWGLEEWITTLWALAPCVGLLAMSLHWLLRHGENGAKPRRVGPAAGRLIIASLVVGSSAAMLLLPPATFRLTYFVVLMIRTALCIVVPTLLAVGIAATRGHVRSFFAGGTLPALLPLCVLGANFRHVYDRPCFIAMTWALIPLFGAACVFFHWLFQRGEASEILE